MKSALLAFAIALLRLAPASGFVSVSPGPTQRHQTAKPTFSPPTRRRERLVAPPTALSLASGAEAGLLSSPVFWSVSVMLTIVGLLKAWELSVEALQENSPPAVRPVIERRRRASSKNYILRRSAAAGRREGSACVEARAGRSGAD